MRTSALALAFLVTIPLFAQTLHQATPVEELMKQIHAHGHLIAEMEPVKVSDVAPAATKTFAVTAQKFSFTFTPSPFAVNQGDTVTLDITSSDVTHGFFIEQYFGGTTIDKGQHKTITFVASTAGTFTYACTVYCGSGHYGMSGTLVVNAAANPPAVSSFTPRSGSTAGGTVVTFSGTNFQNGASVKFGGVSAVSVDVTSSSSLSAMTPAHAAGAVNVTITNPDGQSANAGTFTYNSPGPSIGSIVPSTGTTAGGTPITINGSGFVDNATVTIGGAPASDVVVVNSSTITAVTPAGPFDLVSASSRDVVITLPNGTTATSNGGFIYTLPLPSITSVSPNTASIHGGATVTLNGAGFTNALLTTVKFGGVAGSDVRVSGPTSLTVTAPPHAAGSVDVVVTVGQNSATASGGLTYVASSGKRRAVRQH